MWLIRSTIASEARHCIIVDIGSPRLYLPRHHHLRAGATRSGRPLRGLVGFHSLRFLTALLVSVLIESHINRYHVAGNYCDVRGYWVATGYRLPAVKKAGPITFRCASEANRARAPKHIMAIQRSVLARRTALSRRHCAQQAALPQAPALLGGHRSDPDERGRIETHLGPRP
jgi:hypothetical protein